MTESIKGSGKYARLFGDIIVFMLGTVLAKAIQFFLMPLYTSYLTTEAYGVAELVNNLSELFFPIVTLCIYEAAFRYAVDESFDNKKIVAVATRILLISLVIGTGIAIIAYHSLNYRYAFYLLFVLYGMSFRMTAAYYVRGKGLSKVFSFSGIVNAISLALCNILFLIVFPMDVAGYLISIGTAYIITAIYLVFKGGIHSDISLSTKVDHDSVMVLLHYSMPLIFYNILYWINTISGRYILLWFTDANSAGLYIAAIKIAAVINMIQQAVYAAFQLNASREFSKDKKEQYYSSINNSFTILYCSFGAAIICCTHLLALFTLKKEFIIAEQYLPIIMFAAIINCVSSLYGAMYSTYKKTKKQIPVSIIGAVSNVIVCFALTPIIGIWGVCIGSLVCYSSQALYKMIDTKRMCGLTVKWKLIAFNMLCLASMVFIIWKDPNNGLILSIAITAVLYIVNIYEYREGLKKVLQTIKSRRHDIKGR